jgi:hypothetical protein
MKYPYGSLIRISMDAGAADHPGQIAEVVGYVERDFNDRGITPMYLVEFADGSAIELPEDLLEQHLSPE